MTREEIVKRGYKKFPQNIIEMVNDDSSITREDCNCNLRNAYMQGLIDNNISFSTDVDEAAKEYLLSVDAYRNTDYGCKFDQFDIEIFKAGAVWRQSNLWKSADGDDLPEIDREVVVFTQSFPNDAGIMKVGIAHRPNPNGWDGRNILTGEVNHYTPKTYGKGGWSIPDVKIWLDCPMPYKEGGEE